jgi:serine/threonine protein kinase/tetratricopeptide (TPR) repeat protein
LEAYDPELGRKVAIKILLEKAFDTEVEAGSAGTQNEKSQANERLVAEAKSLARLSHPNIVPIFDVGCAHGNSIYLAMELVVGTSLRAMVDRGPLPWRQALAYMLQAGEGLAAAHAAGLLHRDFKPENLMVNEQGTVLVLDFGLATDHGRDLQPPSPHVNTTLAQSESQASSPTSFCGTPSYMAPEQWLGGALDASCDIFAFGCVLYELLAGTKAYPQSHPLQRLDAIRTGGLRFPNGVPTWLRALTCKMLAFEPRDRGKDLQAILSEIRARLANDERRARRRRWLPTVLLLPLIWMAFWYWPQPSQDRYCRDRSVVLDSVWNASVRDSLAASFVGTGVAKGGELAKSAIAALNVWREDWENATEALCVAGESSAEGGGPAIDRELARACLNEIRIEVETLLHVWAQPSAAQILDSSTAIASLSRPTLCTNAEHLIARAPLPSDLERRQEVLELRAQLGRVRIFVEQGDLEEANETLAAIRPRAVSNGDLPLLSDLTAIEAAIAKIEHPLTVWPQERAVLLGIAANRAKNAAFALTQLWFARVYMRGEHDVSADLFGQQNAAAGRTVQDLEVRYQIQRNRGIWHAHQGNLDEGMISFARAVELAERLRGSDSILVARAYEDLGTTEYFRNRWQQSAQAYQMTLRILEAKLPEGHFLRVRAIGLSTFPLLEVGFVDEVSKRLYQAWAECVSSGSPPASCRASLLALARNLLLEGRFEFALNQALALIEIEHNTGQKAEPNEPWSEIELARCLMERGELQAARELAEHELARYRREANVSDRVLRAALVMVAEIALRQGDVARAGEILTEIRQQSGYVDEIVNLERGQVLTLNGQLALAQGQTRAEIDAFAAALALTVEQGRSIHFQAEQLLALAHACVEQNDLISARSQAEMALELAQASFLGQSHRVAKYHLTLGEIAISQGRWDDALVNVEDGIRMFSGVEVLDNRLAPFHFVQAQALWALDRHTGDRLWANALAQQALQEYVDWDSGAQRQLHVVRRWLATHGES